MFTEQQHQVTATVGNFTEIWITQQNADVLKFIIELKLKTGKQTNLKTRDKPHEMEHIEPTGNSKPQQTTTSQRNRHS